MLNFKDTKKLAFASVIALLLWTFVSMNISAFVTDAGFDGFNFIFSYILTATVWVFAAVKFDFSDRLYKIISVVIFALTPFIDMQISMLLAGDAEFGLDIYMINVLLYTWIMAMIFAVSRSMRWSGIITTLVCYVFNLATYVVNMLRGIPLIPSDFLAIGTAMRVAENYVFVPESPMIAATAICVFAIVMQCLFSFKPQIKFRNLIFSSSGVLAALILAVCFGSVDASEVKRDLFDQHHANNTHGVAFSFFLNAKSMKIERPENYSAQEIEAKLDSYQIAAAEGKKPNILAIMNESFADLSVLGEIDTNEEYMPFFNSLRKNTIRGELLVSPFGGYTCNTEFEFLTGMSMGLLPNGAAPYLQYIQTPYEYSLPNHMSELGYNTVALHPYFARGWNRDKVYGLLGFDDFISIENMGKYQNENEFEYIRSYMSDRTSYSAAIAQFVNKNDDKPLFLFNVTMQNHGGYGGTYEDFVSDVDITNLNGDYSETEQYLSLIKESDKAFEDLVYYFSMWDEPIIIVMFGDHQPAVEQEFYEEMLGGSLDSLSVEELQARYRVPFVIWANFDIESRSGVLTSPNYLSNLLLETASLPKSKVNVFLDGIMQQIPRINAMGHYNADGSWETNDVSSETLNEYANLEYYMLKQKNKSVGE